MATYVFTLVLSGPTELTDDLADKLVAAGCDDATPSSSGGTVSFDFGREASDLECAIRSAIANVFAAGVSLLRLGLTQALFPASRLRPFQCDKATPW